jgi:biopolymer transport protein ExbB
MDNIMIAVRTYMEAGGDVLWLIAVATFVMWMVIFERVMFIYTQHRKDVAEVLVYWNSRDERQSWTAELISERLISEVNVRLRSNMGMIKTLISLLPLLGLLGTVTGMIQVFEAMAYSGGNARSMAAGVSAATIPTMSGMVATLSGVFANTFLMSKVEDESEYIKDNLSTDY